MNGLSKDHCAPTQISNSLTLLKYITHNSSKQLQLSRCSIVQIATQLQTCVKRGHIITERIFIMHNAHILHTHSLTLHTQHTQHTLTQLTHYTCTLQTHTHYTCTPHTHTIIGVTYLMNNLYGNFCGQPHNGNKKNSVYD